MSVSPLSVRPARLLLGLLLAVAAFALLPSSLAPAAAAGAGAAGADDSSEATSTTVEVLPIRGMLDPPVASAITRLLDEAADSDSSLVVLQVQGPGGVSIDTLDLVNAIADSAVPVAVLVAPQAGIEAMASGAWAAVWAAADIRAVSPVGSVGPLQPADLSQPPNDAVTKRVLDLLGDGAPVDGATAALLEDQALDAETLESSGLAHVVAPDYLVLMSELDGREVAGATGTALLELGEDVTVRIHSLGLIARMLHAAATPAFIYLLLVIGLGLLAFELFQPGFGVAGFAGLVMLPFAVFGLTVLPVAWWALALLLVGLALYVIDTSLAGFGWVTVGATAMFGVGSWFIFGTGALRNPSWVAVATTLVALGFWVVIMTVILRAQAGPESVELADLVGRLGIVRSVLDPEGHVYVGDALWRARLTGGDRLRVSSPVRVTGVDGAVLVVKAYDAPATNSTQQPGNPARGSATTRRVR